MLLLSPHQHVLLTVVFVEKEVLLTTSLSQIPEQPSKLQKSFTACFIHFGIEFDRFDRQSLWYILRKDEMLQKLVRLLETYHQSAQTSFEVKRGGSSFDRDVCEGWRPSQWFYLTTPRVGQLAVPSTTFDRYKLTVIVRSLTLGSLRTLLSFK